MEMLVRSIIEMMYIPNATIRIRNPPVLPEGQGGCRGFHCFPPVLISAATRYALPPPVPANDPARRAPALPPVRRIPRPAPPDPHAPAHRPRPDRRPCAAAFRNRQPAGIAWVLPQIPPFQRVRRQVEQLRRHADEVDVFEIALADHERAGRRTHGVILAHHHAGFRNAPRHLEPVAARQVAVRLVGFTPAQLRIVGNPSTSETGSWQTIPSGISGSRHDQRHAGRILIHVGLAPHAAITEVIAVVAGVDHPRAVRQARVAQRVTSFPIFWSRKVTMPK